MTVACATRFNDSSLSAVKVAAALARKRKEALFLVHVAHPGARGPQALQKARATLDELTREAQQVAGGDLEVGTGALEGPLGRSMWQFCREREAGLLVVGDTHRHTGALFESTLDQFAYQVDVPVLVVRDEGPLLRWVQGDQPLRTMLALDRTVTSEHARDWVTQLAGYGPLELLASHVWWPPAERERRGIAPSRENDADAALEGLVRREIERALRPLPRNVKSRVHLEIGLKHVADRLLAFSAAELIDLFVLGTHPHPSRGPLARLWSVSRDVLALAPMSVVCVPGPAQRQVSQWVEPEGARHAEASHQSR